jgi:protein-S-isoprenylcysteine O-methyltransferase Ste14
MRDTRTSWTLRARAVLARVRVAAGFVLGAIVLWLAEPTRASLTAGTAIAALGEAVRFWAAGHLHKSREVTASGPYRWSAHPLYIGSSVMGIGLAVACHSIAATLVIGIYLGVALTVAARNEEAFLRQKFGAEYDRYHAGDAADRSHAAGEPRRFSFGQAIANREYRAVVGLLAAALLLALKAAYDI